MKRRAAFRSHAAMRVAILVTALLAAVHVSARSSSAFQARDRLLSSSSSSEAQKAAGPPKWLFQANFTLGTYRIREPGTYRLAEDIEFGPRPDNDYWPTPGDPAYPMSIYYLGFFAAITVECADVVIDLNGKTLKQTKEFYLKQRFWNNIELADRLFVDNEGVGNMNYQTGDKQQWVSDNVAEATLRLGPVHPAVNVCIKNGRLGLSSHAGVHGNGAQGVKIVDVEIVDFEVAGIHCNGCSDMDISRVTVGPSSTQVPVLATFANARFLDLLSTRLIPAGFAREKIPLSHLLDPATATIAFADRPAQPVPLVDVFERNKRATELYTDHYMGRLPPPDQLSPADQALLREAQLVFTNHQRVTDGSVVYGILINHLGLPNDDEDFFGSGLESRDVTIRNTVVKELSAAPLEVVALRTSDGTLAQGPARDLLRVFDMVSDGMWTLMGGRYHGNFLSDTYFALWQLANTFYETRIIGTGCGNFASNVTVTWRQPAGPLASVRAGTCLHEGFTPRDPVLVGRDVSLYQKKYFGGLAMSEELYRWATTPGRTLERLLASDSVTSKRIATKHTLVCDFDTMFHPMQGVVGIKGRWVRNLVLDNVKVANLTNLGEDEHWLCKQRYRLPDTGEDVVPEHAANARGGADVRGVHLQQCEGVTLDKVSVTDLNADEGRAIGFDLVGDQNDRTDYVTAPLRALRMRATSVRRIKAGNGRKAYPYRLGENAIQAEQGLSADEPTLLHNDFKQPKAVVQYGLLGSQIPLNPATGLVDFGNMNTTSIKENWLKYGPFRTEPELLAFRYKALAFLTRQYGVTFPEPLPPLDVPFPVQGSSDTFVTLIEFSSKALYQGTAFCTASGGCRTVGPRSNAYLHDFVIAAFVGPSGLLVKGVFGGDAGKFLPAGNFIFAGTYSFEAGDGNVFTIPGTNPPAGLHIQYFPTCPLEISTVGPTNSLHTYLDCELYNPFLGEGRATGSITYNPVPGSSNPTLLEAWASHMMIFDDEPANKPTTGTPAPAVYANSPSFGVPDVMFHWVADGSVEIPVSESAREVFAYTNAYHWLHEAGIKYLRSFTSYKTDDSIRALRRSFLVLLRDRFGVAAANPDRYQDNPLENQLDLGLGNTIAPYVVNELANQRVLLQRRNRATEQVGADGRLMEGGFRLLVGRGGIMSPAFGFLPPGTLIVKGVYVMQDPLLGKHEMQFESSTPAFTNDWSIATAVLNVTSPVYGEGFSNVMAPVPMQSLDGLKWNVRGVIVWKNGEGTWTGPCTTCPL